MKREQAFTLIELMIVVAIIGVLVTILVPVIVEWPERARIRVCQANLRTIAQTIGQYGYTHKGRFPRLHDTGDPNAPVTRGCNNLADLKNTNAMSNMWVLVQKGLLGPAAFRCPGDDQWARKAEHTRFGWVDRSAEGKREFSYGIHWPYEADEAGNRNPADPAKLAFRPTSVLMADLCDQRVEGSGDYQNHRDGFCYVTLTGNSDFHDPEEPDSVVYGEDIYGDWNLDDLNVLPDDVTDVVITPTPLAD